MATKPSSAKLAPIHTVVGIPLEKLHLEANPARDSIIGPFGHNETTVSRIRAGIAEVGRVVEPLLVGPMGYRDDTYRNTPSDMYPVLNGSGRKLALDRLKGENPTDQRWFLAPCIIQESGEKEEKKRTKESVLTNLAGHIRNEETSLGRALSYQQWSSVGLKSNQQIATLYGVTGAEITNYLRLLRLPEFMQTLLVEGETDSGLWSPTEKGERNGKKMSKLTASFAWGAVRRIAATYSERLEKKDITDVEYHAALNIAYTHWEKSGVWDEAVIVNYLNGMLARAGKEPIEGKAKAKTTGESIFTTPSATPATPNTPTGNVTPGNGKDGGMGRASKDGDPKEVKTVREAIDAKESAQPPQEFSIETRGAALWIGNHLSQPGMPPQLQEIGKRILAASWVYNAAKQTVMASDHKTALDDYIRNAFAETASTAATN